MSHVNPLRISQHPILGALLLAIAVGLQPAAAEGNTPLGDLHIDRDGRVLAARVVTKSTESVRLQHDSSAVQSDCLVLNTTPRRPQYSGSTRLLNTCKMPVSVSYCVDAEGSYTHDCQAVGKRSMESTRLQPGQSLLVDGAPVSDSQVNWVACGGDQTAISSLTQSGTHGECLVAPTDAQLASSGVESNAAR